MSLLYSLSMYKSLSDLSMYKVSLAHVCSESSGGQNVRSDSL